MGFFVQSKPLVVVAMAPSRRKGAGKAAVAAASRRQWKVGDLVLAKVKGFPAWPATVWFSLLNFVYVFLGSVFFCALVKVLDCMFLGVFDFWDA